MGHPDFQDSPLWRGPMLAQQNAFALSTSNPFSTSAYVNNYNALHLRVVPPGTNAGYTVTLSFYTDQTQTIFIGSFQWTGTAGQTVSVSAPILGNFVTLSVTTAIAGAQNTIIMLQAMNLPATAVRYTATGNAVEYNNQSVPASSSVSQAMPFIAEGPGYFYFSPRDALAKLTAQVWHVGQAGGQISKIAEFLVPTTGQYVQFFGSNLPVMVFVVNIDAGAAHSFDLRCCIDGR